MDSHHFVQDPRAQEPMLFPDTVMYIRREYGYVSVR